VFGDAEMGSGRPPGHRGAGRGSEDGSEDEEMGDAGEGDSDGEEDQDGDADHDQKASRRLSHQSAGPGPASAHQPHSSKSSKGALGTKGGATTHASSWPLGPDNWAGLGVSPALTEHLVKIGFERPTLVQRGAIPPLLKHR
jgi:hypothetical protein